MKYLGNAFSAGMLSGDSDVAFRFLSASDVRHMLGDDWESCVGHDDTALLLTALLGVDVQKRRVSTELRPGDVLYVAQYNGPRLPDGATSLPKGAKIRWIEARVLTAG
jgi:hypothetical protein